MAIIVADLRNRNDIEKMEAERALDRKHPTNTSETPINNGMSTVH
jgi:hypothetical protein